MVNILCLSGKTVIGLMWIVLLFNLIHPFAAPISFVLWILMAVFLMMHLIQLLIYLGAYGEHAPVTKWDCIKVIIFGVFGLIDLKKKQPQGKQ